MDEVDVAIIGSGVIGLSCAWRLAQGGASVVLIDSHPASGASYVAAGMLAPITEATYGEEGLSEQTLRAAAAWPGFAAELEEESSTAIGYLSAGTLLVGADAGDLEHLRELHGYHEKLGLSSAFCPPSACREIEPLLSPVVRGGIWSPSDHQVDNRALLAALLIAVFGLGVRRVTERGELAFDDGQRLVGVRCGDELFKSKSVLLAAGHSSPELLPASLRGQVPVRPVKGQILRLYLADHDLRPSVTLRAIVAGRSVYLVPRADGRLVVGATVEEKGTGLHVTAGATRELLADATTVLPSLSEAELLEVSAGLRPASPDNLALIGPSSVPGLYLATGHYRNGILFAPLTAAIIAEAIGQGAQPRERSLFAGTFFVMSTSESSIVAFVNGESREFEAGTTVEQVAVELDATRFGCAIARNGDVLLRGEWKDAVLAPGDRLEVLSAAPGG